MAIRACRAWRRKPMPAPKLSLDDAREAFEAIQRHGGRGHLKAAAEELGLHKQTLSDRARKWEEHLNEDPAISEAKLAVGTGMRPNLIWAKTKSKDGTSFSVLLKPDPLSSDNLDRIRETLEGLNPVKPVKPPTHADSDLLTLIPVSDLHGGMMAWGKETGEDYDTQKAVDRLVSWVGQCISSSPKSKKGVILFNGDTLHANDDSNQTKRSGHVLDVDTRQFRTLDMVIRAIGISADLALHHFEDVEIVVKPGNHDPDAWIGILFAMAERYRNEPRVTVNKEPSEFWAYSFGKVMLAAHHGDKAKAVRLVLFLADEFPEMWGQTRFRYLWTGHLHHHKSEDIGGVQWEQLRAVTSRDAYAASHAYSARSELQAITYHRNRGEVARVKVAV